MQKQRITQTDDCMNTEKTPALVLPSGGYRKLKSFQLSQLIYDITVPFTELYISSQSRSRDQMVQAARSGVQNIAEGSIDAATSVRMELNLYNVARASLEELRLDYQDYLRQHNSPEWGKDSPLYQEFVARRIADRAGFKAFIRWAESSATNVKTYPETPYKSILVANATLLLIASAVYFLRRQIEEKSKKFIEEGGFSERMHQIRREKRKI